MNAITSNKIHQIYEDTFSLASEDFLRDIVKSLANCLEAEVGFVCDLADDENFRALSFWHKEDLLPPFRYPAKGSPCEEVRLAGTKVYPCRVAEMFPDDPWLKDHGIEGYAALPLMKGDQYLGHFGVMTCEPFEDADQKILLLEVFAERIAAEVTRARVEEENQQLARKLVEIQEAERRRLAQELHDDLAQDLVAAKLSIGKLRQGEAKLGADAIDHAIESIRRITSNLRPLILDDIGIKEAILAKSIEVKERLGTHFDIDIDSSISKLSDHETLALYRICQELLTNILRHSKAEHAKVSFKETNGKRELLVSDDGTGFDTDEIPPSLGLIGISERARSLGGLAKINSHLGRGTEASVTF